MYFSGQSADGYLKQYFCLTLLLLAFGFLLSPANLPAQAENKPEKNSHTLLIQGYEQLKTGNIDDALVIFDKVLEQDASNLKARLGQAIIFSEQKRHEDAFIAYDWITQQNPQHIDAWNGRGLAAFNMENFDEALASFQMTIVDQPVNGFYYESIAWTQMCLGDFQEAAESAKQALLMYNSKGETSLYPLLIAYFSYHESGSAENALRTLQYASKNKPSNQWPAPVIDYLNGKIDESEMISFVSNPSEETEAHTYIGLYMRLLGEIEIADRHLGWVSKYGDSQVFEYILARALKPQKSVVMHTL